MAIPTYKVCFPGADGNPAQTILFGEQTEMRIFPDDNIRTIKLKILNEMLNNSAISSQVGGPAAYEEVYLYGYVQETTSLLQMMEQLPSGQEYAYADIARLLESHPDGQRILQSLPKTQKIDLAALDNILSEEQLSISVKMPIGMRFSETGRDPTFATDPFSYQKLNADIHHPPAKLYYLDELLLLNFGAIVDNTIYVCLAERVLSKIERADISEYITRYYYPALYTANIHTNEQLTIQRNALISRTSDLLTAERIQHYQTIQTFYGIGQSNPGEGEEEVNYLARGVTNIHIRIKNVQMNSTNLEMLFKNMHATQEMPYIKYNPGNRRENLYRLYYEKTTRTGKKVPQLDKSHILKMARETGSSQQITVYLKNVADNVSNCYLHFNSNGDIQIQLVFSSPQTEEQIENIIVQSIRPKLDFILKNVRSTGYRINSYTNMRDNATIQVLDMEYSAKTVAKRKSDWNKMPCIFSVCTMNVERPGSPPIVRLKRVENFKEMDAAHIFVAEMFPIADIADILEQLVLRGFAETREQATIIVAEYSQENNEKEEMLIEKPGYPIDMKINVEQRTIEYSVKGVLSIYYLDTISILIDAFIKIGQLYKADHPLVAQLKKLCAKAKKFKEPEKIVEVYQPATAIEFDNLNLDIGEDDENDNEFVASDDNVLADLQIRENEEEIENGEEWLRNLEENIHNMEVFNAEEEEEETSLSTKFNPRASYDQEIPAEKPTVTTKLGWLDEEDENEEEKKEKERPNESTVAATKIGWFGEEEEEGEEQAVAKPPTPAQKPAKLGWFDDEEEEGEQYGGEGEDEDFLPDGMPLGPINPFLTRLQERDPVLFGSETGSGFKGYSVACQRNRQPIVLSEKEYAESDKSAFEYDIKYGITPDNQNHYVCPRFWCFKTNSAISEKDVREGKCGGKIIPKNAKVIPPGAYIYELDPKYKFPGFASKKHPNGHCLPCCFGTDQRDKAKVTACEANQPSSPDGQPSISPRAAETEESVVRLDRKTEQYIVSLDTYPLPRQRWGFLPIAAQRFLNMDYRKVIDPNVPANLQIGKPALLRYGVEQAKNRSFLGSFAQIYAYKQGISPPPSVAKFQQILKIRITLDIFTRMHNGSLLSAFMPKTRESGYVLNTEMYTNTEFASKLNMQSAEHKQYFENAVLAYENFLNYLSDPESIVTHAYMWDFVCSDLDGIIPGGLNLVILEVNSNDIIDHIELICPTSLYSNNIFDPEKETVILLKHDDIYEPVFLHERMEKEAPKVIRFFKYGQVSPSITYVLNNVKLFYQRKCPGLPSLPQIYKYAHPVPHMKLAQSLRSIGAMIKAQVLNYQGKTIGFIVTDRTNNNNTAELEREPFHTVYLPCYPTARIEGIAVKYMDDLSILSSYERTVDSLQKIANLTKLPYKPKFKLLEDHLVVGFLLETNQFVPIQPTENIFNDGIIVYNDLNHFDSDKTFATYRQTDESHQKRVRNIELEAKFYYIFRNYVRRLFSKFENRGSKTEIQKTAMNPSLLYSQKVQRIEIILRRKFIAGHIVFVDIDDSVLADMSAVTNCESREDESPTCIIKENGDPQLAIPKRHLISGYDNERIYVGRLADELVRNERVKEFMYDTKTRLNTQNVDYQINDDEFILVQSALTAEYFDGVLEQLEMDRTGKKYPVQTNQELANPSISITYPNIRIPVEEQYKDPGQGEEPGNVCLDVILPKVKGNRQVLWGRIFPPNAVEIVYHSTPQCSFEPMRLIMRDTIKRELSIPDIKQQLWVGYQRLFAKNPEYLNKVVSVMKQQGKAKMCTDRIGLDGFQAAIFAETYNLSDMDYFVLAMEYNVNIIMFNANGLKGFKHNIAWLKMGGKLNTTSDYCFIRSRFGSTNTGYNVIKPYLKLADTKEFIAESKRASTNNLPNLYTVEELLDSL